MGRVVKTSMGLEPTRKHFKGDLCLVTSVRLLTVYREVPQGGTKTWKQSGSGRGQGLLKGAVNVADFPQLYGLMKHTLTCKQVKP
jgi:hypothetical protein